jgi:hypothetical protein
MNQKNEHRSGFGQAVYSVSVSPMVELLRVVAVFGILYSIYSFATGADERQKAAQYQAWQVINSAQE